MTDAVLLSVEKRWECPSCGDQQVTRDPKVVALGHCCKALASLSVPYVQVHGLELRKHAARHRAVEREDYISGELVQTDGHGRPVMAVNTDYADGRNDCTVYAPTARAFGTANQ